MTNGFTKLFSTIITSSIWSEDDKVRIMWVTMLASADATGYVSGSIPGMGAIARMSIEDAERAIQRLCEPDPYSRTPDHEGRRLLPAEGGWIVVNYERYRAKRDDESRREYQRQWDRDHRPSGHQRTQSASPTQSDTVRPGPTQAEAEAEAEDRKERALSGKPDGSLLDRPKWTPEEAAFEDARRLYPGVKRGHDTEFRDFRKKHKDWRTVCPDLVPAIKLLLMERGAKTKRKEFTPEWAHFKTWLSQRRWEQAVNVQI